LTKLLIVIAAVRILNSKSWLELILTTPLNPAEYIRREARLLIPRLSVIFALCLLADLMILIRLRSPYLEAGLAILVFTILDAIALGWVGLWNGLRYRNASEAISFSLSTVILVPAVIASVCLAFGFRTATFAGAVLLWGLLCLAVDILAASSARWMLRYRLRLAVSG
jgi:hypothetical protein